MQRTCRKSVSEGEAEDNDDDRQLSRNEKLTQTNTSEVVAAAVARIICKAYNPARKTGWVRAEEEDWLDPSRPGNNDDDEDDDTVFPLPHSPLP